MPKTPQRAEFWICDHCGKPIIPKVDREQSGFVVVGNIMVVNSKGEFDGGIIGDNFPQTKAFSIDDVGQCIFHTHCLIDVLGSGREHTCSEASFLGLEQEESEEQVDDELHTYVVRTKKNNSGKMLFWNRVTEDWVTSIADAAKYYNKRDAEHEAELLKNPSGHGKPHIWKMT